MSLLFHHCVIILLTDNALNPALNSRITTDVNGHFDFFWCFETFLLEGWIMSFILCIYCFYLEENWIINSMRKEGH